MKKPMVDPDRPFTIRSRLRSFRYAFEGLWTMLHSQHNAWIHLLGTVGVSLTGWAVGLTRIQWCMVVLCIVTVWTAEGLNTAFEFLAEVASPEYHPMTKKAKDVAAGAVLIAAIGAVIVGSVIFFPRFYELWIQ